MERTIQTPVAPAQYRGDGGPAAHVAQRFYQGENKIAGNSDHSVLLAIVLSAEAILLANTHRPTHRYMRIANALYDGGKSVMQRMATLFPGMLALTAGVASLAQDTEQVRGYIYVEAKQVCFYRIK
jgi:hypothetical protein